MKLEKIIQFIQEKKEVLMRKKKLCLIATKWQKDNLILIYQE